MIQRRQSLYLLLIVLLHIILYWIPLWVNTADGGSEALMAFGLHVSGKFELLPLSGTNYVLFIQIVNVLVLLLAAVSIFLYRSREIQHRLTRLGVLLEAALVVLCFLAVTQIRSDHLVEGRYRAGIIFPLISLVLFLFAGQRIRRDEELVRSSDRLR